MPNEYDVGDVVRITFAFTDDTQAAADPSTVRGKFRDPTGAITTYVHGTDTELEKDGTGAYHFDISVDRAGDWRYRGEGEGGAVEAASEGRLVVRPTAF